MNYGELKNQFQELLNRSDCSDSLVVTFLRQGFSRLQRELRIPPMEREVNIVAESPMESVQLPNDFLEMRDVLVGDRPLEKLSLRQIVTKPTGGFPSYYTRRGDHLVFRPYIPTGQKVDLLYYGEFGPMEADTDVNELSLIAPDLCIYAALSYAGDFFDLDKRVEWEGRYEQIRDELNGQAEREEMNGGSMMIQPAYPMPEMYGVY